jgi:hypothetical protein
MGTVNLSARGTQPIQRTDELHARAKWQYFGLAIEGFRQE